MRSKTFFIALVALLAVGLGIYFYLRPPATGSEQLSLMSREKGKEDAKVDRA
jgi:hypothetical protein